MTPTVRCLAWTATAAVAATGVVYAAMAYCMEPADPMAIVNHPWQPTVLHWHVLTAPLWLFAFGVLWQCHIWPKWRLRGRARRRTGIALVVLGIPMALSGYLLQTSVDEMWREVWIEVHVYVSLSWLGALFVHVVLRSR